LKWIIFDWIGGALGASETDPNKLRLLYQTAADQLAHLASDHNLVVIAFAQAHQVMGINRRRVDASVIAECKSIGRTMHNIIGISAMLEKEAEEISDSPIYSDTQWFYVSKSRKGLTKATPIRRNFAHQRFDDIF